MFRWCRHENPGDRDAGTSRLVAQCEAFLDGTIARERLEHEEDPAPWEWMNVLAHGSAEELQKFAELAGITTDDPYYDWPLSIGYLAERILDAVAVLGVPLDRFQREVLVPLELRMAAKAKTVAASPDDAMRAVLTGLQQAPHFGGA